MNLKCINVQVVAEQENVNGVKVLEKIAAVKIAKSALLLVNAVIRHQQDIDVMAQGKLQRYR